MNISEQDCEMLDPWYVTGFCDGEAAFTYSRAGGTYGIYFGVRQREDNRKIVENIQQYFGYIGNIYQGKGSKPTNNSGFTKSSAYYRVTRVNELKIIINHFDKYQLQSSKKQEIYQIWREMVLYKAANYRKIDYNRLQELAEKLSGLNMQSRAFVRHKR